MNIALKEEDLKAVVSEAILRSLDEQQRNLLIQQAIVYLITPGGTLGRAESPIKNAFNYGIEQVARKMVTEELEQNEEVKEKMRALFTEAFAKVATDNREAVVNRIADSITSGLAYKERY